MGVKNKKNLIFFISIGLVIRGILVFFFVPDFQSELFTPFIQNFITSPTFDPWQSWLSINGRPDSFPYGFLMLLYLSSFTFATNLFGASSTPHLSISLSLLVCELFIWFLLSKNSRTGLISIFLLAFSPILVFATYIHGQLDLIPSALLFAALLFLRSENFKLAGFLLGISISIKFSGLLILPLIILFLIRSTRYKFGLKAFLYSLTPGITLTLLPLILPGYREMVAKTPQIMAIFQYSIKLSEDFNLLLTPIILTMFIASIFFLRRANIDLLFVICSMTLASIPLFMPSSPGWFLWGLLPLVLITADIGRIYQVLFTFLGFLETLSSLFSSSGGYLKFFGSPEVSFEGSSTPIIIAPDWVTDLSKSLTLLIGLYVYLRIGRECLRFFDPSGLIKSPISFAVAGDSGTGKDTLCNSLSTVFGENRFSFILGDDYHNHERDSAFWRAKTHLNPLSNDLDRLSQDSLDLLSGNSVWSRQYDHDNGRFSKPRKISAQDVIAISGLHVLSIDSVRNSVDLTIYLEMDEELRKLNKVRRDLRERNKSIEETLIAIEKRFDDASKYVHPQKNLADVILNLRPISKYKFSYENIDSNPEVEIEISLKNLSFGPQLSSALIALTGVQVELAYSNEAKCNLLTIKDPNFIQKGEIESIIQNLTSNGEYIYSKNADWLSGTLGIYQMVVTLALIEKRSRRWKKIH